MSTGKPVNYPRAYACTILKFLLVKGCSIFCVSGPRTPREGPGGNLNTSWGVWLMCAQSVSISGVLLADSQYWTVLSIFSKSSTGIRLPGSTGGMR